MRLAGPEGRPVHYQTVAKAVGVSKWTAYDVLRELERLGLVEVHYLRDEEQAHGPGRSRVFFVPTELANQTVAEPESVSLDLLREWHQTKERLLRLIGRADGQPGNRGVIEQVLREMPQVRRGLIRSAYLTTVLVLQCQAISRGGVRRARVLLESAPHGEFALGVFAGVVGSLVERAVSLASAGQQSAQAMVARLEQAMARLTKDEARMLADFIREALIRSA